MMTRLERIKLAIERGVTYDPVSGKIYGSTGIELKKSSKGYIRISIVKDCKTYLIQGHQFAYYIVYGKLPEMIDHINGKKDDNRIVNLRECDINLNNSNRVNAKGHWFHKRDKKWFSAITIDYKRIYLGQFDNENDARIAYVEAKKKYHNIEL